MSQFPFHPGKIFVFGSNIAGIHGAGAAREAVQRYGATYGSMRGFQGSSYAIPTKNEKMESLKLVQINQHVADFLVFASIKKSLKFFITPIGTGLAGYSHSDIAPMFRLAPDNCELPEQWKELLK